MCRKIICSNDIVESIKDYDAVQLRIFYNFLYKYKEYVSFRNQHEDEEVELSLDEVKSMIGKYRISENEIKNIITSMSTKILLIDRDEKIGFVNVFQYIIYDKEYMEFRYSVTEKIKPFLLELVNKFTIIQLNELALLQSRYSQRFYELSCRYIELGVYLMPIDDFKTFFNVPKSYKMGNIDQKILKPCINEVNDKTSKRIRYTKIKKGRNVTHIKFNFKEG